MWRPGYEPPHPGDPGADLTIIELDGPAAPPTPSSPSDDPDDGGAPTASRRGRWVVLALLLAVVVVAAVAAFWIRSDESVASAEAVPQRAELAEVWSTVFDGRVDEVRIADGGVFVMSALDGMVVRYDVETGDEVWSVSIGDARDPGVFEVVDDVVVVGTRLRSNRGLAQIGRVHVLDRDDGSEVWREANTAAAYQASADVVLRLVSERTGQTGQLLDILTGDPVGEVLAFGRPPFAAGNVLASRVGGNVRIVSVQDGSLVRPEIRADGLERVVGVGDDVLAIRPSGEFVRVESDGALTPVGPARVDLSDEWVSLVELDDAMLAVDDATERIDVGPDSVESRWRVPGSSGPPADTTVGAAVIAQLTEPDGLTSYALVDLADGSIRWQTEPAARRVDLPTLLVDGVLLPPKIGESQSLSALDIDGNELWTLALPGTLTATAVGDAAVAVVSRIDDTSSVTVYR